MSPPPRPIQLPPTIGDLVIVRTVGLGMRESTTLVRCPHGHEEWRLSRSLVRSVARGRVTRCSMCPAPATSAQLLVMQIIRDAERNGQTITRWSLEKALKCGAVKDRLETLLQKGWVEREGKHWFLTDEGIDLVDGPMDLAAE